MMKLQKSGMQSHNPDKVEREERNCMRLAKQSYHLVEEYRERFFTHVLFQSPTHSISSTSRELPLVCLLYVTVNGDDKEIDQLELDWITWQRDYMQNRAWSESRTSILESMQCNAIWLNRENLALGASDW